jgi:hypothetical protein
MRNTSVDLKTAASAGDVLFCNNFPGTPTDAQGGPTAFRRHFVRLRIFDDCGKVNPYEKRQKCARVHN